MEFDFSLDAHQDLLKIVDYTFDRFGEKQALKYTQQLDLCARRMANGKGQIKLLSDINESLCSCHCQHHYIFGLRRLNRPFLIIAIIHERMDLIKRITNRLK